MGEVLSAPARAMLRARKDFEWYCATFVKIKDKSGQTVPLVFNDAQKIIVDAIDKQVAALRPIRIVIVKGRQQGCSTLIQAYLSWRVFFRKGQNALTIAHDLEPTMQLFEKIEMIYDELPLELQPERRQTKQGRKIALAAPLRGMLYVETSQNPGAGRSGTWNLVHASEVPSWAKPKDTMLGLLESVPSEEGVVLDTAVFVESTAKGVGDYFHDMWLSAASPENPFDQVFIPWFKTRGYRRKGGALDAPLSGVEVARRDRYGLSRGQLLWYRDKASSQLDGPIQQEYPDNAVEAFVHGGVSFFQPDDLSYIEGQCRAPLKVGMFEVTGGRARLVDRPGGAWWLWALPVPRASYVVFCDPASGRGRDNTAITVLEVASLEVVATFRGKIDPDEAAVEMIRMGMAFNYAMLCPETNNHGEVVISKLVERGYPRIYRHRSSSSVFGSERGEWGLRTTTKTRPLMLGRLLEVVRMRRLLLYCSRTLEEMRAFHHLDDSTSRAEAITGARDDLVISLGGALLVAQSAPQVGGDEYWVDKPDVLISEAIGY